MVLIIRSCYFFPYFFKSLIHCKNSATKHESKIKNEAFRQFKKIQPQYTFYVAEGGIEQTKFRGVHGMRRDFRLIPEVSICHH